MLMALEREERAEGFERMDVEDERQRQIVEGLKGLGIEGGVGEDVEVKPVSVVVKKVEEKKVEEVKIAKVPSQALMGVSVLGSTSDYLPHSSQLTESSRRPRRDVRSQILHRPHAPHPHHWISSTTRIYPPLRVHLCRTSLALVGIRSEWVRRGGHRALVEGIEGWGRRVLACLRG
jgi:hypothetical protein